MSYLIGGGGGGGYESISIPLIFPDGLGPYNTESVGGPDLANPHAGSTHHDTSNGDIYYRDSVGWSAAYSAPGAPYSVNTVSPASWQGSDGDYWANITELEMQGPKAAGVWPAPVQIAGWSLIEVMADPVMGDGSEGDWAWQDMGGGTVRVYGPKQSTGWSSSYRSFTGIDTATPKIYMESPPNGFAQADEIWIRPGSGVILNSFSTYYMTYGGYTTRRLYDYDPLENMGANKLFLGGNIVNTTVTNSFPSFGNYLNIAAYVDGTILPLASGTNPTQFGLEMTEGVTSSRSFVQESGLGGPITLQMKYGSSDGLSLGVIREVDSVLNLYFMS